MLPDLNAYAKFLDCPRLSLCGFGGHCWYRETPECLFGNFYSDPDLGCVARGTQSPNGVADCDLCRIVGLGASESIGKGRRKGTSQLPLMGDSFGVKNGILLVGLLLNKARSLIVPPIACYAARV